MDNESFSLISTSAELSEFCEKLKTVSEFSLDIEGESNLHRYGFHLCLIQICFDAKIFIIDPMSVADISCLGAIFKNEAILKIMCAADFDVKLLKKTRGMELKNIFDVQIGAKILGCENLSLKTLLESYSSIFTDKSRSNQKSNWNKRPLTENQLEYAANDVKFLFNLRDKIKEELLRKRFFEKFLEENKKLEHLKFKESTHPHLDIPNAKALSKTDQIYLKQYYFARERAAKKNDIPSYKIIKNKELIALAELKPCNEKEWIKFQEEHGNNKEFMNLFIETTLNTDKSLN